MPGYDLDNIYLGYQASGVNPPNFYPSITTSGTTVINFPKQQDMVPALALELTPLEWLREQVGEVCELASAA